MIQVLLLKLYYNNTVYPLDPKQSSCKRSLAVPGCFAMLGFVRPFVIVVLRHHGLPQISIHVSVALYLSSPNGTEQFSSTIMHLCSRVYCHCSISCIKAFPGRYQISDFKQGCLGTMKSSFLQAWWEPLSDIRVVKWSAKIFQLLNLMVIYV